MCNYFLGKAATNVDCKDPGQPGKSTQVVCKITDTVVFGIRWKGPKGEVMRCTKDNTACVPVDSASGYSVIVDPPTRMTLTIASFNATVHAGSWSCTDGASSSYYSCRKKLLGNFC